MKRLIDYYLLKWKSDPFRMPLLLRGARQIGKTFAVRQLGKSYEHFVEINFELIPAARTIFNQDLYPDRIIKELSALIQQDIIPGKTLLFFDEIQSIPTAITALRYFHELLPQQHVIAAGSLLDFAIAQEGVPVGRVEFLYMYPLSFIEYLAAIGQTRHLQEILQHNPATPLFTALHEQLLKSIGTYLAFGGMPQAVHLWITTQKPVASAKIHSAILNVYRQDFEKYARLHQIKYVEKIFKEIPKQLGKKFKYSSIDGDYRKRELAPALDLLITAGIAQKVSYSAGQGIPLDAQNDPFDYKIIFLDAGLAQASLGANVTGWFIHPEQECINKGALVEAFVGQEISAYASPDNKYELNYWHKETGAEQAEIDYLVQIHRQVIPVEVKAGDGRTLRSINHFLDTHRNSPYGIRFSTNNYSQYNRIHSYPLYAIAQTMTDDNPDMRAAIESLLQS